MIEKKEILDQLLSGDENEDLRKLCHNIVKDNNYIIACIGLAYLDRSGSWRSEVDSDMAKSQAFEAAKSYLNDLKQNEFFFAKLMLNKEKAKEADEEVTIKVMDRHDTFNLLKIIAGDKLEILPQLTEIFASLAILRANMVDLFN